jgi:hypothetical protein
MQIIKIINYLMRKLNWKTYLFILYPEELPYPEND